MQQRLEIEVLNNTDDGVLHGYVSISTALKLEELLAYGFVNIHGAHGRFIQEDVERNRAFL